MTSRSKCWQGALVCIAVLASLSAGQEEQWLQYRVAREASDVGIGVSTRQLKVESDAPADVELPEFKGERQCFAQWSTPMVEKGYLLMVLDGAKAFGPNDRLYIDSNGDGNLKDEIPITAYRMNQYNAYFGPVKVVFEIEDGPVTYHLNVRCSTSSNEKRLYASSAGWYEGDITVGGAKRHCMLADYNANGVFNDKSSDPGQCDRIRIGGEQSEDARFVGNYVQVDDVLYTPEIARDGAYIKLAEAEGVKFGQLRMTQAVTEVSAGGENGLFVLHPEDGVASLPIGSYRLQRWAIKRTDDRGAKWEVQGRLFNQAAALDVTENAETELAVGEPIVATLEVSSREGTHSFRHNTRGRDGERIELTCNGTRPRAPQLRITNKEGTYDRVYNFAYG